MTQSNYKNDAQHSPEIDSHPETEPNADNHLETDTEAKLEQPKKMAFAPYKNDHQSMQIGELVFENQMDKVIVYGDIDIFKTGKGLEQALRLQQVFNAVVDELQRAQQAGEFDNAAANEANVSEQTQTSKVVDNPFS